MNAKTTGQNTSAALLDSERRVLERIANGAPLTETLDTLVRLIEEQADGMRCAVLLADTLQQKLRFVAAPSIPEDYKRGIDPFLRIAPNMPVCGSAAFLRKLVCAKDTANDALLTDCRDIAVRNGLRAIWSTPILANDGAVRGTFAMYYSEPRLPSEEHLRLIEMATQMARVALEAKSSEELLRTVFDGAPGGMGITDLAGNFVRVNPAFAQLLGYTQTELQGKTIADVTHEEDYPRSKALIGELLAGKRETFVIDKRCRRKDGKIVWLHNTVALLHGAADEPRHIVVLIENTTQRKQAQDELQRSAAQLQTLSRRLAEMQGTGRTDTLFEKAVADEMLTRLSPRERQVLQLLGEGQTNTDIAATLSLSAKAVETYRARMEQKLGIHHLAGLIKFAIRHGVTSLD